MARPVIRTTRDMTDRVKTVYECLKVGKWLTTSQIMLLVKDRRAFKPLGPDKLRAAVGAVIYELRENGWTESRKTAPGIGKRGEYEHTACEKRRATAQPPLRQRKHTGNGAARMHVTDDSALGRALAAAKRIEEAAKDLAAALPDVHAELSTYAEIQKLAARLAPKQDA